MTRPVSTPQPAVAPPVSGHKPHLDLRHCLIPGESAAELDTLTQAYLERYQPDNLAEEWLLRTMIQAEWNKLRWSRVETQLIASARNLLDLLRDPASNAIVIQVQRRLATEDTRHARALAELRRLQKQRTTESPAQTKEKAPVAENWVRSVKQPTAPPPVPPPANPNPAEACPEARTAVFSGQSPAAQKIEVGPGNIQTIAIAPSQVRSLRA